VRVVVVGRRLERIDAFGILGEFGGEVARF
jgi:hypothetical protein